MRKKTARISQKNKTGKGDKERLSTRDKLVNKYYSTLMAAERVADKDYFFKMDDKAGRVHTSLSNLKKELRNFLTYDGKRLVEVDIKNSQPFFSLALFNKAFFSSEGKMRRKNLDTNSISYSNNIMEYLQRVDTISFKGMSLQHVFQHTLYEGLHQTSSLVMVYSMIEEIVSKDISHYREIVLEGIYEHLLVKYIENTGRVDMDRNDMKKVMFTILFSMNEEGGKTDESFKDMKIRQQREMAKDTFRSCFPKVMEVFEFFKEDNYRLLACLLQSIEAHVVLDKICGRIKRERPGTPIFTLHDSIMTTVGNETYLKQIIKEECLKHIGVKPSLDVNLLHPDNLIMPQRLAA
ncbi:hypothetical protein [Rufibacter latericius]|uniref:DNA-directed DNA polymerase family A palm domain-containing protein n=1 Tax=Rufibacter latericius TaxID=2487040 RepID=A0A3M9MAL3_9BACT|nr:hypothetical protein [Rufibacter latericius]RNI22609.1 hypothetical protein EFB08_21170 [Rufibacter latericius]